MRHLGVQDGSGSQEFLDRATFLRADGVLVAATADGGVTLVDTNAPDHVGAAAALRFDGVAVRRGGDWQPLPAGPRLRLTERTDLDPLAVLDVMRCHASDRTQHRHNVHPLACASVRECPLRS